MDSIFTFELLGMNMMEWAMYIGVALAAMLVVLIIVKSR